MNKKFLIVSSIGVIILLSAFMIGGTQSIQLSQNFSDSSGKVQANVSGSSALYDADGNVIADLGIVPGALTSEGVTASHIWMNLTFTVEGSEVDWGSYKLSILRYAMVQKNGGEAKQLFSTSETVFERSGIIKDKVLIDAGKIDGVLGGLGDGDQVRFKYYTSLLVTARSVYQENLTAQALLGSFFDLVWEAPSISLNVDNTGGSGGIYVNPWGVTVETDSIVGGSSSTIPIAVLGLVIIAIGLYFSRGGKRIF